MAESEELSIIQTKCTALKKNAVNDFQVVVHNRKRRKETGRTSVENNIEQCKKSSTTDKEIDMKKARFEVFKFAMSGLKSTEKQKAKEDLAIQLGAKPFKNKGYNYKEYKQMKEKQRKDNYNRKTYFQ
ncbi:hypothetical protein L9F63_003626 [Diploptera punctata]|uniref:Uncharacterized protein n=1 Tax=Diploptera punctata TaxID=6984 RepID=A0AAD8E9G1_DIPPU|nr:hypothetical protein L9F63_003626 [Diploptera punctata]